MLAFPAFPDCFWSFPVFPGCSQMLVAVLASSWLFLFLPSCSSHLLTDLLSLPDCSRWFPAVPGSSWLFPALPRSSWLLSTRFFLTMTDVQVVESWLDESSEFHPGWGLDSGDGSAADTRIFVRRPHRQSEAAEAAAPPRSMRRSLGKLQTNLVE